MQLDVGAVVEGKVTRITGFGAFVELDRGQSGLVHISEISDGFVKDVNEHLTIGQTVKVKVLSIESGKINLSVKKAQPKPKPQPQAQSAAEGDAFEDKLKRFMQESDKRIAGNPMYADKSKSRKRRN